MADMKNRKRCNPNEGEKNHQCKFTDKDVLEMREAYRSGKVSIKSLSIKYGGSPSATQRAIRGISFKYLALDRTFSNEPIL